MTLSQPCLDRNKFDQCLDLASHREFVALIRRPIPRVAVENAGQCLAAQWLHLVEHDAGDQQHEVGAIKRCAYPPEHFGQSRYHSRMLATSPRCMFLTGGVG
jgi:hypothetical protein